MASANIRSGDIRYGVIGERNGLALRQGRIGTGRCEGVGLRVPLVEMPKYAFDHIDIVDECDDAHVAAAVDTLERVDLVDLLNQPGPSGLAMGVGRRLVDADCPGCVIIGRWRRPVASSSLL